MATLRTSIGNSIILSPFKLNISMIVKSKAYCDIRGMNFLLFHFFLSMR